MKELFVQHVEYSPEEKEAHYDLMDYINAFGWAITAGSISEDSFWKMCQRSKEENGCLFLKLSEYLKNKYGDLAKEKEAFVLKYFADRIGKINKLVDEINTLYDRGGLNFDGAQKRVEEIVDLLSL